MNGERNELISNETLLPFRPVVNKVPRYEEFSHATLSLRVIKPEYKNRCTVCRGREEMPNTSALCVIFSSSNLLIWSY